MPRHAPLLVLKSLGLRLRLAALKHPPPAFSALLRHPPQPTPALAPRRPPPIACPSKDRLRRAFFRDHPLESYRPRTLVEVDLLERLQSADRVRRILPDGSLSVDEFVGLPQWESLAQRSRCPCPEDCVDFAHSLHVHSPQKYSLNTAYSIAVSQFRTLRFEHTIRASFARQEAEAYHEPEHGSPQHVCAGEGVWKVDLLERNDEMYKRFISDLDGLNLSSSPAGVAARHRSVPPTAPPAPADASKTANQLSLGILDAPSTSEELSSLGRGTFNNGQSVLEEIKLKSKRLDRIP